MFKFLILFVILFSNTSIAIPNNPIFKSDYLECERIIEYFQKMLILKFNEDVTLLEENGSKVLRFDAEISPLECRYHSVKVNVQVKLKIKFKIMNKDKRLIYKTLCEEYREIAIVSVDYNTISVQEINKIIVSPLGECKYKLISSKASK